MTLYSLKRKMARKYKFVSEPSDALVCLICHEVAEEPWQHGQCGRLFCRACLDEYDRQKPCSTCRASNPQYFQDNKSKTEIQSLKVKCNNDERECEWEGTVGTLKEHLTKCDFSLLSCPNKCIEEDLKVNYFMRKDLDYHLAEECPERDYECTNGESGDECGEKGTYSFITGIHDNACKYKVLPCPNTGCHKQLQRKLINKHVKYDCEYTMITCKHKIIGCKTQLRRKDMTAHELDDTLHLHMAINTITMLKNNDDLMLKPGEAKIFRFIDYQVRKESKKQFLSPPFYTSQGYHMAISVYAGGDHATNDHVSVYIQIEKGKHDSQLKWPLLGAITITLLNQNEDKNHHNKTITLDKDYKAKVGASWGYSRFIAHTKLKHDPAKTTLFLKKDTLYFRVEVKVNDHKPWLEYASNM